MSQDKNNGRPRRTTGLLVIEVLNSNPNGDPDRESDPRQRPDRRGEISPVSFKRKLRDLVEEKEGPVWQFLKDELSLNEEEYHILESRGRERAKITQEILNGTFSAKYWDARVFGNTFLEKGKDLAGTDGAQNSDDGGTENASSNRPRRGAKSKDAKQAQDESKLRNSIKSGVVQFGLGLSIAPIAIERMTNTNKAGVEVDKDRGMAPLGYRIVPHGVYTMPFFINPTAAVKSGCTQTDIELLYRLIPQAYAHSASYVRPSVGIRHAWVIEHKSPLGSCSDFDLLDALRPRKRADPDQPSTSWADYEVPPRLPDFLQEKVASIKDLVHVE